MAKERLDMLLVQKGYFDSRERAKRAIMAGMVLVDDEVADKPGTGINEDADIRIKGDPIPYVSRGGLKLEKGIKEFGINLYNLKCMDIGASTGGFTDCMLINGAAKVYAIDVGYGQLAWKLRTDPRVVSMERTNFRYVKQSNIKDIIDFASADVSFISLEKIIPPAKELLARNGKMLCLIKPQFEAGRDKVGKKGVVRDADVHFEVIEKIVGFSENIGFDILGLTYSPVKGPEGNIEYLLYIERSQDINKFPVENIKDIVLKAHSTL